ncbi:Ubiquinone biosynthesis O-methyltransferase, mitochondrial [Nakaseomyces bracarensis]|uniref:Ubiquinone biosynthesis O-methyltransferase, mitochondrial n=1 Tax=Nakaseomyces bracarensis TaxID=273131 RepID=A0ABR4NP81_9SACH
MLCSGSIGKTAMLRFGIGKIPRVGTIARRFKSTEATADEISHFTELAPTWWDPHGPQRILHLMNNARLDFIQRTLRSCVKVDNPDIFIPGFNHEQFLPSYVCKNIDRELTQEIDSQLIQKQYSVLDIGCGGGLLGESMARLPFISSVYGIDLTPEVIAVAREHAKQDPALVNKLDYDLKALEDVKEKYDIVTCFEMLEHVDYPSEILKHAWNRLNPGGVLYVSTINRDPISWFTTIFMAEEVLSIVPKGTHHLSKYINSKEIREWFSKNQPHRHKILDCKGMMYLPLKGWVEHECPDFGNYFMAVRKSE